MLTKEFGKRLKYWREKRGMTQTELAERSGVFRQCISYYERGIYDNPALLRVEWLLGALNVSIVEFYSEEINHGESESDGVH